MTEIYRYKGGSWAQAVAPEIALHYDDTWYNPCNGPKGLWHFKDGTWHRFPCGGLFNWALETWTVEFFVDLGLISSGTITRPYSTDILPVGAAVPGGGLFTPGNEVLIGHIDLVDTAFMTTEFGGVDGISSAWIDNTSVVVNGGAPDNNDFEADYGSWSTLGHMSPGFVSDPTDWKRETSPNGTKAIRGINFSNASAAYYTPGVSATVLSISADVTARVYAPDPVMRYTMFVQGPLQQVRTWTGTAFSAPHYPTLPVFTFSGGFDISNVGGSGYTTYFGGSPIPPSGAYAMMPLLERNMQIVCSYVGSIPQIPIPYS